MAHLTAHAGKLRGGDVVRLDCGFDPAIPLNEYREAVVEIDGIGEPFVVFDGRFEPLRRHANRSGNFYFGVKLVHQANH